MSDQLFSFGSDAVHDAPVTFFVTRSAAMLGGDGLPGPA